MTRPNQRILTATASAASSQREGTESGSGWGIVAMSVRRDCLGASSFIVANALRDVPTPNATGRSASPDHGFAEPGNRFAWWSGCAEGIRRPQPEAGSRTVAEVLKAGW